MKTTIGLLILNYLRLFAKLQIAKISLIKKISGQKLTIVGVTGSAGKSSTINACQAALQDFFRVKTTAGSNSESGIPLNILGITSKSFTPVDWLKYCAQAPIMLLANWKTYDVYLVEMGIDSPDEPKNMSYLLKIVQPTIGIFLNVNLTHAANFDKTVSSNIKGDQRQSQIIAKIGAEKAKLVNSLPPTGYALLNTQDPTVLKISLTVVAHKIILKPIHLTFDNYAPPSDFDISISAAINLAKLLGISQSSATASLQKNLILPPSRSSLFTAIKDSKLIDSSYNSSPLACQAMLDVLKQYPSPRIAILGDMRELGQQSAVAHQHIYRHALKCADQIISVGPETKQYFGDKATKFDSWWQASEYIKQHLKPQSTLLIKGSQNTIYLEELVKELSLSPGPFCRQSDYWLKTKAQFRQQSSQSH